MKELKHLKELVETIQNLYASYDDINLLIEMGYEDEDPSMAREIEEEIRGFETSYEELRIQTLLSGEYDECHRYDTRRGRRNRILRLGQHAVSYVQPLGRAERIHDPGAGLSGRGYCGHQDGNL